MDEKYILYFATSMPLHLDQKKTIEKCYQVVIILPEW